MARCYVDEIKKDILKLINKSKEAGRFQKEVDEERFQLFIEQLNDVTNPATSKIGPLSEMETVYLRFVYGVIPKADMHFQRNFYNTQGFEFGGRDLILWIIQTKLAYFLRKNSECSIVKENREIKIPIEELELNAIIIEVLHDAFDIQTVDQLTHLPLENIYKVLNKNTSSQSLKIMLYELYEIVHNLGYEFKGEEKRSFVRIEKENPEEVLDEEITILSFGDKDFTEKVYKCLRSERIYEVGDLISFYVGELHEKPWGRRMFKAVVRTIHEMGLAFADEVFVCIENPYFNKAHPIDYLNEMYNK